MVAVEASPSVDHVLTLGLILSCEDDVCVVGGSGSGGGFPEPLLGAAATNEVLGVCLCCGDGSSGLWCCPSESAWLSLMCWAGVPWDATSALP